MSETVYPKPHKIYVRKGRCTYCGSKKIKTLYGYDWCDKTCAPGALGLEIYERENHLGPYAPTETEPKENDTPEENSEGTD